eukprot:TRINITY_DN15672_c0_g1_i1.p1 TRINITY_DN15672_c0_g1~~TRINITY_DN15672_c0_g1_i1.p1  ORF type:complete len:356 (+),score=50.26 TRINITY_DN15672_c0_g1_i1:41-1108(+)
MVLAPLLLALVALLGCAGQDDAAMDDPDRDPWWGQSFTDTLALTSEMQRHIFRHQHPASCGRSQRFLAWRMHNLSLAADVHMLSWGLARAINENRVLVLAPGSGWRHAPPGKSLGFFFRPLTNCTDADVGAATDVLDSATIPVPPPNEIKWMWTAKDKLPLPTGELLKGFEKVGVTWWRAQTTRYTVRPLQWLGDLIDAARSRSPVPQDAICMHIHRQETGDAMADVPKPVDFYEEADNIRRLQGFVDSIFITTWDPDLVEVFRRTVGTRKASTGWKIATPDLEPLLVPVAAHGEGAVDATRQLVWAHMHLDCSYYVATRNSHLSRLIDELRMTMDGLGKLVINLNGPPQYGNIG